MAVGGDINFDDLVEAKERLIVHQQFGEQGRGSLGVFLAADVTHMPFGDAFFDLVICSEVLEHIPNHEAAVRELVRVLKPGQDLVVSVPRWFPERICWALSEEYYKANGGHIRIYKKKHLVSLLERAGVRRWANHFAHGLHTPYWWLKCLVGPTRENSTLVNLYHRLLVWDMMQQPRTTRTLENLLNPILGKSVVLYLKKEPAPSEAFTSKHA